ATEANISPGMLDIMSGVLCLKVKADDLLAYICGILAHSAFTDRFAEELGRRELRVPITKDPNLFDQVLDIGRKLIWLHTYGQRFVLKGYHKGQIPKGSAKCTKAVSDKPKNYPETYDYNDTTKTLTVGDGQFQPVSPEIYEFEVSGLKVVKSWLNYRMKFGNGRKSSPLDDIRPERWTADFTTELLELLWVLEHTLAEYPKQAELLEKVITGPLFKADEFPEVPEPWRKPPPKHSLDYE
ncbi:MAG: type ISP restriction/modification enzyme, partial [Pseudomonadota bacterium]